jgi:hypothetical protein
MAMQILCETQGRADEAKQYGELAHRFWKNAEVQTFDAELAAVRQRFGIVAAAKPTTSEGTAP